MFMEFPYIKTEAAASDAATRYTALVLDLSGSMRGTPMAELQKAAKNFCGQVLSAEGENYVAIVNFDARVFIGFSNDPDDLNEAIEGLSGSSSTPLYGLNAARDLFASENLSSGVKKNIIIMSDGEPGGDHAASLTAAQALWPDYNVYSLGFFQNVSASNRARYEEAMRKLQNAGFYVVENAEDLDFAFNDIADDIVGDGSKNPIIFVPGIMGSDLYDIYYGVGTILPDKMVVQVWLPITGFYLDFTDSMAIDYRLNVKNPDDHEYYGTAEKAKKIVETIRAEFPDRKVYFFAYDWRQDCELNAKELEKFVNTLDSPKVDIVAHSMGGLVASSYFKMAPSKIDKIITLATPYEGSPEAITRALSDTELMDMGIVDSWVTHLGKITPAIKRAYPALAQLAPTSNYHVGMPMREYDIERPPTSYGPSPYDPISLVKYEDILKKVFPPTTSRNIVEIAKTFHNSIHQSDGYNALLSYDKAYFILATGQKTLNYLLVVNLDSNTFEPRYENDGDGTVPHISASIMGRVEELPSWRWHSFNSRHTDVISNEGAIDWVVGVLKHGMSDVSSQEYNQKNPYTTIRVACPVDVEIVSNDSLSSKMDSFSESASFGRMDIIGENGDIKMFCLDDGAFPVTISGTGIGTMDYTICFYDKDNNFLEERNFDGVAITSNTIIKTDTARNKTTFLYIDSDGDGKVDLTLSSDPDDQSNPTNPSDPPAPENPTVPSNPAQGDTKPAVPDGSSSWGANDGTGGCNAGAVCAAVLAGVGMICFTATRRRKRK
jgi:pimeloyl-ACP methyl ester carboxylesterase